MTDIAYLLLLAVLPVASWEGQTAQERGGWPGLGCRGICLKDDTIR